MAASLQVRPCFIWAEQAETPGARRAGGTGAQAEAFRRRIDDQLALFDHRPVSTTTFAVYAQSWVDVWPLKPRSHSRQPAVMTLREVFAMIDAGAGRCVAAVCGRALRTVPAVVVASSSAIVICRRRGG